MTSNGSFLRCSMLWSCLVAVSSVYSPVMCHSAFVYTLPLSWMPLFFLISPKSVYCLNRTSLSLGKLPSLQSPLQVKLTTLYLNLLTSLNRHTCHIKQCPYVCIASFSEDNWHREGRNHALSGVASPGPNTMLET